MMITENFLSLQSLKNKKELEQVTTYLTNRKQWRNKQIESCLDKLKQIIME